MSRRAFFALIAGLMCWRPASQAPQPHGLTDAQIDALMKRVAATRATADRIRVAFHEDYFKIITGEFVL